MPYDIRTVSVEPTMTASVTLKTSLKDLASKIRRQFDKIYGFLAWCEQNGKKMAGPNWEVYGDWDEDQSRLRTDVFYLLEDG